MRAISSFETSCTMRVLILTAAFLASASAAPSGTFFGPIAPIIAYSTVPVPAAVPTISPGDLQAAAINAKVQVEQQVQDAADKARELAEQATEKQDEGIIEANDLAKERAEEAFWAAEEQKWQALDALKTAEAQIDGSIASRASDVALAAYSVPTTVQTQTGVLGQSVVTADTKSIAPEEVKVEEQKEKPEEEAMAAVKSEQAESKPENSEKPVENVQTETAKMEELPSVKTAEAIKEVKSADVFLAQTHPAESKPENAEKSVENIQTEAAKIESSASVKTAEAVKEENQAAVILAQTHPATVVSNAFLAQPWLKQGFAPISYIPGLQSYVPNLIPNLIPNYGGQLVNPVLFRAV